MTWQELFDELSTTQTNAFRDGDIAGVRHTIAGIEIFIRNYQDSGAPAMVRLFPSPSSSTFVRRWRSDFREGASNRAG